MDFYIRVAATSDLGALELLEQQCFSHDRLSGRSLQRLLTRSQGELWVAERAGQLLGSAVLLLRRGNRRARLYSLAVAPAARGLGLGRRLLERVEARALARGCSHLRLEVRLDNHAALNLYEANGYRHLRSLPGYYQDGAEGLRLEKRLCADTCAPRAVPYYAQSTGFSCGPACLLMAMAALQPQRPLERREEIQLWREATTVYMTSGHGGCSPQGLALAAWRRGLRVDLHLSEQGPLFLDGVRDRHKKELMQQVHDDFVAALGASDVRQLPAACLDLPALLAEGGQPLVLISSFRLFRRKAPHWVLLTGYDQGRVYFHDPALHHSPRHRAEDCQHMAVSHADFEAISAFGQQRLRAVVVLRNGINGINK
jgi:ribosomal protein S18 acetylase RimI-like enzyme